MIKIYFDCYFYKNGKDPYWYYYSNKELIPKLINDVDEINENLSNLRFKSFEEGFTFVKSLFDNLINKYSELNFEIDYTTDEEYGYSARTKEGYNEGNCVTVMGEWA